MTERNCHADFRRRLYCSQQARSGAARVGIRGCPSLRTEKERPDSAASETDADMYDNIRFDEAFRSDLVVNGKVIAELKSVETLLPVHAKQLLTQLRLSGLKLGLLINFGEAHLKNGIRRVIDGYFGRRTSS